MTNKESNKDKEVKSSSKRNLYITIGLILLVLFGVLIVFLSVSGAFFLSFFLLSIYWLIRGFGVRGRKRQSYLLVAGSFLVLSILSIGFGSDSKQDTVDNKASETVANNPDTSIPVSPAEPKPEPVISPEPKPETPAVISGPTKLDGPLYKVVSVVDGDTIKVELNGKKETIRFIGMDTPETKDPRKPVQCYGPEAYSRMQHYAQSKSVRLESDPSQGDRDKYDRLLRYVYTEDGKNIAYQMIKEGYAREYTYSKAYVYQGEFKQAQKYAKDNSQGLWAANTCGGK